MTRSASPRRSRQHLALAVMPSSSRPSPCSGCGRRAASWRRTSTSSVASRNTSVACRPVAPWASVGLQGLRRTTRSGRRPRPRSAARPPRLSSTSRTTSRSRLGGRLSTTKQPRSSSSLAAVLRPAPVMPVTTTSSPVVARGRSCHHALLDLAGGGVDADDWRGQSCRLARPTRIHDRVGGARPMPGHLGDLLDGGRPQLLQRAEVLEQRLAADLAEPGDVVEQALDHRLRPALPVVGDREPVRLVADPLQQVEPLAACAAG